MTNGLPGTVHQRRSDIIGRNRAALAEEEVILKTECRAGCTLWQAPQTHQPAKVVCNAQNDVVIGARHYRTVAMIGTR